jgi:hypothetical protein
MSTIVNFDLSAQRKALQLINGRASIGGGGQNFRLKNITASAQIKLNSNAAGRHNCEGFDPGPTLLAAERRNPQSRCYLPSLSKEGLDQLDSIHRTGANHLRRVQS